MTDIEFDYLAHGGVLHVDLDALSENWRIMRGRAGEAECGAVVKANAYGIGIEQAVPALAKAGCRTFFVAHLSEAKRVRAVAPDGVIYVLNGMPQGSAALYRAIDAKPVIGARVEAQEWATTSGAEPCALHVDTGMNRLGFSMRMLDDREDAAAIASVNIDLVMTHLVASETPDDPINARQIAAHTELVNRFPDKRHSLLNSSGHFLEGAPAGDLTRPGYGLYGGNPTPGRPNPMKQVVSLDAHIIGLSEVEDGERAGYNGLWTARGKRKLATLSIGYADGIPRNAGGTVEWSGAPPSSAARSARSSAWSRWTSSSSTSPMPRTAPPGAALPRRSSAGRSASRPSKSAHAPSDTRY